MTGATPERRREGGRDAAAPEASNERDMAKRKRTLQSLGALGKAAAGLRRRVGMQPNVPSAKTRLLEPRIAGAKKTPGVCPYCAVGCGTLIYSKGGQILDIEGNPDSPINSGTLCPKGSAQFALHVNVNRITTCKYRPPYATQWQDVSLPWAMERIAARVKETRDRTFTEFDTKGRRVNRTMGLASLGGATLDNEENYLIAKLFRTLGTPFIENQARI